MDLSPLANGILWFFAFLFSTTVHEAAHAWMALRGGDPTAYLGGQVSLSPLPHIRREPIGMLAVPLVTALAAGGWAMGWASAPYDPDWEDRHPRRAAWMAAAGPAANFAIALTAFLLLKVGLWAGIYEPPFEVSAASGALVMTAGSGEAAWVFTYLGIVASILLFQNLILGAFNLLPLPPLDGSAALGLVLPDDAAARLRDLTRQPAFSLVGLLVAWWVFPELVRPLFFGVLGLLHPGVQYH